METVLAGKINGFQKILWKGHVDCILSLSTKPNASLGLHSGYHRLSLEVPAYSQGENRGYWKLHGISSEIYSYDIFIRLNLQTWYK